MICIQKVKRENRLGTLHRCRVQTDAEELSIALEKPALQTIAETDTNGVTAGKINGEYFLRLRRRGATAPRVTEVDDQT